MSRASFTTTPRASESNHSLDVIDEKDVLAEDVLQVIESCLEDLKFAPAILSVGHGVHRNSSLAREVPALLLEVFIFFESLFVVVPASKEVREVSWTTLDLDEPEERRTRDAEIGWLR